MCCCHSKRTRLAWVFLLSIAPATAHAAERTAKDVSYAAKCDGSKQNYLVIYPGEFRGGEPHQVLILLHGHGSDRHQIVDDSVAEFRAGRNAAAARNMLVIAPDYRAKTSWMGPAAEADLLQIIDEIKSRYHTEKIILAGASMGGSSALTFTALHPDLIDGVISMNGTANHLEYGNFQDAISKSFGGTKAEQPLEYKNRSAEYWPERFTMPVAITASGQDKTVPPASVLRLADTIKKLKPENVLLLYREQAGHNTNYDDSKAAFDFVLDKVIATTAKPRDLQTAK